MADDLEKWILRSMLGLSEDVYFCYSERENAIDLYNTRHSRYQEGAYPIGDWLDALRGCCGSEAQNALEGFAAHLREHTPRFVLRVPANLYNQEEEITCTLLKGMTVYSAENERRVIGLIHPLRERGRKEADPQYDALTGALDKENITRLAIHRVDRSHAAGTTLAIVDIDYFKHVNDNFGHQYGDEVLRGVAEIILRVVGDHGTVGRIGGDEFLVVFDDVEELQLREFLRAIKEAVINAFPGKGARPDSPLTVSMGSAAYPKDAENYEDLFMVADYCLYVAKQKGRNRYVHYTPAKHLPLEVIRQQQLEGDRALIYGRDDLSPGEALAQIQVLIRYGDRPPIQAILLEFAERFHVPLVLLWPEGAEEPYAAGVQREDAPELARSGVCARFLDPCLSEKIKNGMLILDNVDKLPDTCAEYRDALLSQQVRSLVAIPFTDAGGRSALLALCSLHQNVFWNEQHHAYYRLFADEIARYTF